MKSRHTRLAIDVDLDPVKQCGGTINTIHKIFQNADLLVPNRSAVKSLYPDSSADTLAGQMAQDFGVTTIITAGVNGVYYCKPRETVKHQPAFEVSVIDPVGAGDAFHGGLLFALSQNWALEEAVRLGARCGALNCQAFGARTGMPTAARPGLDLYLNRPD